jgi:transcriptional regulator with XRE-family HTH domain
MARTKSLSVEENAHVVDALRRIVAGFPSQAEAAAALGMTQQSISRGIGAGPVGVDMALAVARHLGVGFEALIGGSEAKSGSNGAGERVARRRGPRPSIVSPARRDTLGERVQHAICVRGMSLNALNRAMGKGSGFASRFLGEERRPRADTLAKLAAALNVSTDWLATGEGRGPEAPADALAPTVRQVHEPLVPAQQDDEAHSLNHVLQRMIKAAEERGAETARRAGLRNATDAELLDELQRRLSERNQEAR